MRNTLDASTGRSEEHTSELQSRENLVCRLRLEKKKNTSVARSRVTTRRMACGAGVDMIVQSILTNYAKANDYSSIIFRSRLIPPFFFFNDPATTEIYTLSLHDALPICGRAARQRAPPVDVCHDTLRPACRSEEHTSELQSRENHSFRLLHEKRKNI